MNTSTAGAGRSTLAARPSTPPPRHLFRDSCGRWCTADVNGITIGLRSILGDVVALDFNTAINLSRHYSDQADDAARRGFTVAEERWATWSEQLEIWAAKYFPAPARRKATQPLVITRSFACDQHPTFAEMVGQGGVR